MNKIFSFGALLFIFAAGVFVHTESVEASVFVGYDCPTSSACTGVVSTGYTGDITFTCTTNCAPVFNNHVGVVTLVLACDADSPSSYTAQLMVNGNETDFHTQVCNPPPPPVKPFCPYTPQANRTIADFYDDSYIVSNDSDVFYIGPRSFSLPAGKYDIRLVAWEGETGRSTHVPQLNEVYHLSLRNGGAELLATNSTSDVPDNVDEATVDELVNSGVILSTALDEIKVYHSAHPDYASPNSVHPICAVFDFIQPTATISGEGCTIADGSSSCDEGILNWSIQDGVDPDVINNDTEEVYSGAVGSDVPVVLRYGLNNFYARSAGDIISPEVTVALVGWCESGSGWDSASETCIVPPPPPPPAPVVNVVLDRDLVRSGGSVNAVIDVVAGYDVRCTVTGLETTPTVFDVPSTPMPYSITSRALTSAQEIVITCAANPVNGSASTVLQERVNVIPTFQEL